MWKEVFDTFRSIKTVGILVVTSLLISANWGLFIWAVQTGHLVESSLGYYINPLVNVLLGVVFLRERLRRVQLIAVALAVIGVANQSIALGVTPWLSLVLAGTFGAYGLLRKVAPVAPMAGLFVETALVSPIALLYLGNKELHGAGLMGNGSIGHGVLLALCGVITAVPLIWFAQAAKGLTLSTLGLIQYISPTFQLLLAVVLYGERFSKAHIVTFAFIWTALLIYSGEAQWIRLRRTRDLAS
jgi:chloramphenicol-sensitive protein RarD